MLPHPALESHHWLDSLYVTNCGIIRISVVADLWALSHSNFFHFHAVFNKNCDKQECIPVGCVPPASMVTSMRGGVCPLCLSRVVCVWGGVCPGPSVQGVSAWGCLPRGVYTPRPRGRHTPREQNDWQTDVKTLPSFVSGTDRLILLKILTENSHGHPLQSKLWVSQNCALFFCRVKLVEGDATRTRSEFENELNEN